ncbi:MAG: PadR family transcriptional regulator [Anaerolineales bacterium]|nr:PadR family transcriptional regulator [Anaerolineales bacterium]
MSLQHTLLGFLNYGSMTGYELKQTMDVSTANFWYAKQSQIYMTLKKMEEKGLVFSDVEAQDGRPDRRVYTITDAGRAALDNWLAQPVMELQPKKELVLLKLFFSSRKNKEAILTQLRLQRDLHQNRLEHFEGETASVIRQFATGLSEMAKDALLWDATRQYGVMYSKMSIQWLDETIAMIDENF